MIEKDFQIKKERKKEDYWMAINFGWFQVDNTVFVGRDFWGYLHTQPRYKASSWWIEGMYWNKPSELLVCQYLHTLPKPVLVPLLYTGSKPLPVTWCMLCTSRLSQWYFLPAWEVNQFSLTEVLKEKGFEKQY